MQKVHIAHINLARGFRGGERQTLLLIEALAKKGYKQTLVCRGDSPLRDATRGLDGVDFHRAEWFFMGHFGISKSVDLLHAHDAKGARWAYLQHKLKKTPYIITRRIPNPPSDKLSTRSIYKNAMQVVAISKAVQRSLLEFEPSIKSSIIYSASTLLEPDLATSKAIREHFSGKFIVGHIGALVDHHKGQSYILKSAKSLATTHPDVVFLLLGSGKDEQKLKLIAKDLTNVEFVGFKKNVADYIAAFDLFVFPSLEEGLGSTLIDVMRLEKPIVATAVDGIVELVEHERSALLVAPKDADAITKSIVRLKSDPLLASDLASNAKARSDLFSVGVMADAYEDLYAKLQKSPRE